MQEEPPSLWSEQEGDQEFPCLFCVALAHPFRSKGGVWLQEEPSSLRPEQEGGQEFPCLFCAALAHPFRSEGGVECARLPSVGMSSDTSGELLLGKSEWRPMPHSIGVGWWSRDTLQKYHRASLVGPKAV